MARRHVAARDVEVERTNQASEHARRVSSALRRDQKNRRFSMSSEETPTKSPEQEKEEEFLDAVLEKFQAMDEGEQHQTFVEAGIVNQDGELTSTYGGDAEPEGR